MQLTASRRPQIKARGDKTSSVIRPCVAIRTTPIKARMTERTSRVYGKRRLCRQTNTAIMTTHKVCNTVAVPALE